MQQLVGERSRAGMKEEFGLKFAIKSRSQREKEPCILVPCVRRAFSLGSYMEWVWTSAQISVSCISVHVDGLSRTGLVCACLRQVVFGCILLKTHSTTMTIMRGVHRATILPANLFGFESLSI